MRPKRILCAFKYSKKQLFAKNQVGLHKNLGMPDWLVKSSSIFFVLCWLQMLSIYFHIRNILYPTSSRNKIFGILVLRIINLFFIIWYMKYTEEDIKLYKTYATSCRKKRISLLQWNRFVVTYSMKVINYSMLQ